MRHNSLALFVHLVWSTWDRLPLITSVIERPLYRQMEATAIKEGCKVVAINGTLDHTHILLSFPATISIAVLVQRIKGSSSRFVDQDLRPDLPFKWQRSYGAYTVSPRDVGRVKGYIQQQKRHHAESALWPDLEPPAE